jgi:hypothetical protein
MHPETLAAGRAYMSVVIIGEAPLGEKLCLTR